MPPTHVVIDACSLALRCRPLISASLGDFDMSAGAAGLTMPVFVYAAENPFGAMGRLVLDNLPAGHVSKLLLSDCGHLPWLECPDRFLPAVKEFLDADY